MTMNETPKSTETRGEQAQATPSPEYSSFGEAVDAGRQAAAEKAKEEIGRAHV